MSVSVLVALISVSVALMSVALMSMSLMSIIPAHPQLFVSSKIVPVFTRNNLINQPYT
jgi:hypothetical protein